MPSSHLSYLPPSSSSPSRSRSRSPRLRSRHSSGRHTQSSPTQGQDREHGRSRDRRDTQSSPPPAHPSRTSDQERIKELERQIISLENSSKANGAKKQKPVDTSSMARRGRIIPRIGTVYDDLHTILAQYDEYRRKGYHKSTAEDDEDDELEELTEEEQAQREEEQAEKRRVVRGYTTALRLKEAIPNLFQLVREDNGANVIRELQQGANSARNHDTSQIMHLVGQELNKRVERINNDRTREYNKEMKIRAQRLAAGTAGDSQSPDNTSSAPVDDEPELTLLSSFSESTRTGRGLSHDVTGLLLCPVEYDWEIPDIRAAVRALDPQFDFAGSARARCFYKNEEFNPEDPDRGYLQSYLLVQVYRHLFTSPSSAKDQPENVENMPPNKKRKATVSSHRGNVSQICQITQVTPRSIAYAAVHLHLALSDASHYTTTHNGYNYQDLWNFVVDFFEDVPDEKEQKRTKELLKWWNDRIFTGTRSAANNRGTKMTSRKQDLAKRQRLSSPDTSGHSDDRPPESGAGSQTVSRGSSSA